MRMLLPFPSLKGWATFISTYFSIISLNVDWGIWSICFNAAFKYITEANLKFPFAIFTVLIFPAKSYSSSNKYLWILASPENLPISKSSTILPSYNLIAFILLIFSSTLASSAESLMPNLFSKAISILHKSNIAYYDSYWSHPNTSYVLSIISHLFFVRLSFPTGEPWSNSSATYSLS